MAVDALGLGLAASIFLLDGTALVAAWALAAAAGAWLSRALREPRLLVASLGFGGLALLTAVVVEASPLDLLVANRDSAGGALPLAFVVVAALALAAWARPSAGARADVVDRALAAAGDRLRRRAAWIAGAVSVYAVSLVVLEVPSWLGDADLTTEFQRSHTAVSTFWGAVGLALLYFGLARRRSALRLAGFALFGVSLGKLFLYDLSVLSSVTRALSFLAVGAVLLLAGFFYQRLAQANGNGAAALKDSRVDARRGGREPPRPRGAA